MFGPFYPQTTLRACLVSGMRLLVRPANNIMPPKWTFEIVAWAKQFSQGLILTDPQRLGEIPKRVFNIQGAKKQFDENMKQLW